MNDQQSAGSPAQAMPAVEHHHPDNNLAIFGWLRDVRTEAQHVGARIPRVEEALGSDASVREATARLAIDELLDALDEDRPKVARLLERIRAQLDKDPALYDLYGDVITAVENDWTDALALMPPRPSDEFRVGTSGAQRLVRDGPAILSDLVYNVAILTVPRRLEAQLQGVRVGGSLDFYDAFEDEVPNTADRRRILRYLASQPASLSGQIDVETGLVYRVSPSARRRAGSLALFVGAWTLGLIGWTWLLAQLGGVIENGNLSPDRWREFAIAYVLISAGAALHILIAAYKGIRATTGQLRHMAAEDFLLWVHGREVAAVGWVASLCVGLTLLAVLENPMSGLTALFAGYSIDSIAGLAIDRFDVEAARQLEALEKRAAA